MTMCPIHKVEYDQSHAPCMRKYMGIPDPGGPAASDSMLPQDAIVELKKRGFSPHLSKTDTDKPVVDKSEESGTKAKE